MKNKIVAIVALAIILLNFLSPVDGEKKAIAAEKNDYLRIGFDLMRNEAIGNLAVGILDNDVIKNIGEAEKKAEAKVWAADGEVHQSWYYPHKGIELDMVKRSDGKQSVGRVMITTPCPYKTKRGIGIGSTEQDVRIGYKNEINPKFSNESSSVVAGTVYGGLLFSLKDGVVSGIFIGAAAE